MKNASALCLAALTLAASVARADNWYSWRGPTQDGRSAETFEKNVFNETPLWRADISARGCPVVADGQVYVFGYNDGDTEKITEILACYDQKTGKLLWEKRFPDYLSDNAYKRYSVGSPAVDPATGNVYFLTTNGEFAAYTKEGKELWHHGLMEEIGRLTFPNGRTGCPLVVGDLAIARGITANWGGDGPAKDRLYGYDKVTGELVWASAPGVQPQDMSFGTPLLDIRKDGTPVAYVATGCGNFAALNVLTGKPLWRWPAGKGGINSSTILVDGLLMTIHDKENIDSTETGRFAAIRVPEANLPPGPPEDPVPVLPAAAEAWRLPYSAETSSPVYAEGMVFILSQVGVLNCMDPATGKELWNLKLGAANAHSSPTYANGLLYCPIYSDTGTDDGLLFAVKPSKTGGEIVKKVKLEGFCFGPPAISEGNLYITTAKHVYAFDISEGKVTTEDKWFKLPKKQPGPAVALQVIPQEFIVAPGANVSFKVRGVDALGYPTGPVQDAKFESFIPPTAKVKSTLDGTFEGSKLTAAADPKALAGAFKATAADGKAFGICRGRIVRPLPLVEDLESFPIDQVQDSLGNVLTPPPATLPDGAAKFSYPPLPWIGGRLKWEIRQMEDGNKVLYKTLLNVFFQRAFTFLGHPEMSNYTMQADMMTDGNRRMKSEVGLINQRYLIALKGNGNELEVSSNQERLKASVPFTVQPKVWYTLKTRVDVNPDGSGVIRAKAWPKGEAEPEKWTIEVPHHLAHKKGSPGFYGFALQGKMPVYLDNLKVTPN